MIKFDWGWLGIIFLFFWIIFIISICGCQTIPPKITVQVESPKIEIVPKTLSNDECILYAFKIEGWDYNWLGGYLTEFKQGKKDYTINGFFVFLQTKISLNEWYWEKNIPKIRNNYLYLRELNDKNHYEKK